MWQQRVREWLEKEDRKQGWLARKAGVDPTYLSALMTGLKLPGPEVLRKLEKAMTLEAGTLMKLAIEDRRRILASAVGADKAEELLAFK